MDSFIQFKNEDTYLDYKVNFFFVKFFFLKEGKKYIQKFTKNKNIFDKQNVKTYLVGNTMFF